MTEAAQSGKIDMFPRKQKTIVCMVYSSMKNVLWKEIVRQMGFSLSFWWIYLCACTTFWRCCVLLDFSSVYGTFYKKVTTKVVPLRSSTKGFAPHPRKNIAIVFLQCYMYWVRLIDIQSPRLKSILSMEQSLGSAGAHAAEIASEYEFWKVQRGQYFAFLW